MQIENGSYVWYEKNGEREYGYVESFDHETLTYKVRNSRGHILSKKYTEVYEIPTEPEDVELQEDTLIERFKHFISEKFTFKNVLNAGISLIATGLVVWAISVYEPEKPTRQRVITDQINALNDRNVPLIGSCLQMRENDREIRILLEELKTLKGTRGTE